MNATIQLKDPSKTLSERLRASARKNFRGLNQEALAWPERSFDPVFEADFGELVGDFLTTAARWFRGDLKTRYAG